MEKIKDLLSNLYEVDFNRFIQKCKEDKKFREEFRKKGFLIINREIKQTIERLML